MRKAIIAAAWFLLSPTVFAADPEPLPKEGPISSRHIQSGTVKVLPLGKDRAQVSYDVMGVCLGEDIFNNSSIRCVGSLSVAAGVFDDESGSCVFTRPDGDQAFTIYKGRGKQGAQAQGTFTLVGGTGKLAGIQGSGEFTRYIVRPAAEGTSQSVSTDKGTYKLPTSSAAATPPAK